MTAARNKTVLVLAWAGVVLLIVGEVALVGWVQWHYRSTGGSPPRDLVFAWAQTLMGAALVVSSLAFVAFLLSFTGTRNILAGTIVLVTSLIVSGVVISINAWAQ
jgi:hypothetical protein